MSFLDNIKKLFDNFEKDLKGPSRGKENDADKPEKVTLKYEEVRKWLDTTSKPILSDIENHLKATTESLKAAKSRLEKDIKALEGAEHEETRDKRLERAILNNRHALTSRLANYINSIKITADMKPKDSPEFFESIREKTRELMIDTAKNFYFVNSGFPEITQDIKEDLLNIGKKTDEAIEYLEPLKSRIKAIEDSYLIIEEADTCIAKKKEHDRIIREEEKKIKDLDKSRSHLEKDIKAIEKSASMKALAGLENEHKNVLSEIASIKDRIINTVSPMSRILNKYGRVAQHSSKDEECLMNLYMEDPADALLKDDNLTFLKKITGDLELRIAKGTISVKDKMKEKTVSAISRLKDDSDLHRLKETLSILKMKDATLRAEIESNESVMEKAALLKKLAETIHDIESGSSRVKEKKEILATLNQDIAEKIGALEGNACAVGSYNLKIISNNQHENSEH